MAKQTQHRTITPPKAVKDTMLITRMRLRFGDTQRCMRGQAIFDVAPARPLSASDIRPGACTPTNTVHHTSEREGLKPKEGIPHSGGSNE